VSAKRAGLGIDIAHYVGGQHAGQDAHGRLGPVERGADDDGRGAD
jgi:hypothetical protein